MRYSATVAPKHPKLDTPQAEAGIKKPISKSNNPSSNFLNNFTNSFLYYILFNAERHFNAKKQ
jgi:hypothetical protein